MKTARSGISTIAEYASQEFRKADKLDARPSYDAFDAFHKPREAALAREDAERLLKPPKSLVGDASTELVPAADPNTALPAARHYFLDTLAHPNTISVDASEHRAAVATRAGVLSQALDAAVSGQAKNSIEKMLCHQMAAVHTAGMELLVRVEESGTLQTFPPVEIARMTNAAARLFEVYQSACLTLLKLKAKGRQRVLVQYQQVNIGAGGQAVVGKAVTAHRGPSPREDGHE